MPPFGHNTRLRVFVDPDLLQYDEVWAAAGTWNDVFGIEPHKLVEASGGALADLKRSWFHSVRKFSAQLGQTRHVAGLEE